jgi:hypothetical protein
MTNSRQYRNSGTIQLPRLVRRPTPLGVRAEQGDFPVFLGWSEVRYVVLEGEVLLMRVSRPALCRAHVTSVYDLEDTTTPIQSPVSYLRLVPCVALARPPHVVL